MCSQKVKRRGWRGQEFKAERRRIETQQAETSWVKWPAAADERYVGESGEQTGGSVRETMGMGRKAAGPVMWKQTCRKVSGKRREARRRPWRAKRKKGQRLFFFFWFVLNKRRWATLRVGFARLCSFFPPSLQWLKWNNNLVPLPSEGAASHLVGENPKSFFEEPCRRWATAF